MNIQGKKVAVWGTGDKSIIFSKEININVPYFYLDNNKEKDGSIFNGKKVFHPSHISNWKELYIIIAIKNHEAVARQLEEYGLQEDWDFISFTKCLAWEKMTEECEQIVKYLNGQNRLRKTSTLVWGAMPSFDPGFISNLNDMYCNNIFNDFLFVSETPLIREQNVSFPYVVLPSLLCKTWKPNNKQFLLLHGSSAWKDYWKKSEYLLRAKLITDKMLKRYEVSQEYSEFAVYYFDKCIRNIIDCIKPQRVIMWNQFYPLHIILDEVCKEKGITTQYLEYGSLPGTYALDGRGQMGESTISVEAEMYRNLAVSTYELEKAENVWNYLHKSGLNRKVQPVNDELQMVKSRIDKSRPIIFYAGQNDYESGLYPYTEQTKKYHSPVYKSTMDALMYIAQVAEEENWNLIFKPHPILKDDLGNIPSNVHLVGQCNINDVIDFSDVTVTILSQVGYISTIRKKPTVMLGYTQLRGKGCTYESFEKETLKNTIIEVLNKGFSREQKVNFEKHIAQLITYSLFDDLSKKEVNYGKPFYDILCEERFCESLLF